MATQNIEDPVKRKIVEYALITVSIWIMVVGIYFFKFPNNRELFALGIAPGIRTTPEHFCPSAVLRIILLFNETLPYNHSLTSP